MFYIEGIKVKNFKSLKNVSIGRSRKQDTQSLSNMTCFIGKANTGKSNFLDVFSFIRDMNTYGINYACGIRGGFDAVRTRGERDFITFEFLLSDIVGNKYVYLLTVGRDRLNLFRNDSIKAEIPSTPSAQSDYTSNIAAFFVDSFIPEFTKEALLNKTEMVPQPRLDQTGSNLVSIMHRLSQNKENESFFSFHFKTLLGLKDYSIEVTEGTIENSPVLNQRFTSLEHGEALSVDNRGSLSYGTLKYMAYAVLCKSLHEYSLACIEGIENSLYHQLIPWLVEAYNSSAVSNRKNVFMCTHSTFALDSLRCKDVYICQKSTDGFTEITRVSDIPGIYEKVNMGDNLGYLWKTGALDPSLGKFTKNEG